MTGPTVNEVVDLLAGLRDLSGRLARFEDVPQAELDAFQARKVALVERIDPNFYGGARARIEAVLVELAHLLDDIPEGDPIPVTAEQVDRLRLAYGVFPALRRHRYVAHRLGIDLAGDR